MGSHDFSRREFVKAGAALAAAMTPYWFTGAARSEGAKKDDKPLIGAIGVGGQGTAIAEQASQLGRLVAICDVDRNHALACATKLSPRAEIYEDYRHLLDRKEIEAVTIGTPDHWHTAVCLAALDAGKHIYCEKPLTLTVDEGKQLVAAVKRSGKTMQVGTMQRSDMLQFARAVATIRSGRLGKLQKVTVSLPKSTLEGGPFVKKEIPKELNWDLWLGQAPMVDYFPERCHVTFRWWYDYSGGVMTDWGAHHMDVAHWGMNCELGGPITIDGSQTKMPHIDGGYNTPREPNVTMTYPNDVTLRVQVGNEGVMFEGDQGRIKVNRKRITGKPIEEQDADEKLKAPIMEAVNSLFKGNTAKIGNHMGNFFDAFMLGKHPISDVESQHRAVSACHLANISMRLQRKLTWDAAKEDFVGDDQASAMLKRVQREPYRLS